MNHLFNGIPLERVLFFDIETAPIVELYDELPAPMKKVWDKLVASKYPNETPTPAWRQHAGLYAEFAKPVCISFGAVINNQIATQSILPPAVVYEADGSAELVMLKQFRDLLVKNKDRKLCGHNIKNFDIPFMCKRFAIHGLPYPDLIYFENKKPWELTSILDTFEAWKFGSFQGVGNLELLCAVLGIESPKDGMEGSSVSKVFYSTDPDRYEKIKTYCEGDVRATIEVFMKLAGIKLVERV